MPSELPSGTMLLFVGLGVFAFVLFGGLYLFSRQLRQGLATDLKQQITADSKPTSVDVKQPLVVKAEERFATAGELEALEERLGTRQDKLEAKLDLVATQITAAGEDRVRRIHERQDLVLQAVSRVEGELKRLPCDRCTT
jgi:hypothetical protein